MLAVGAHADDIEIGCGATILRLVTEHPGLSVDWLVLSGHGDRAGEAGDSAAAFLTGAGATRVMVEGFRDGFFPYDGGAVKERFERLKGEVDPDLILTHRLEDRHQDHRLVAELTWNTFRDHLILEYEIPKYDGDLGSPNAFVHLEEATARRKAALLLDWFPSQRSKRWFTEDLFLALMRLRGMEAGSPTGYAEAFHGRKVVLGRL
ncbi:MAG: PIG-L deacetylase family protein [Thermoleophilia bacterium]